METQLLLWALGAVDEITATYVPLLKPMWMQVV
jgi:hypothetical protein